MYHIFHDTHQNFYYYADEEGFSGCVNSLQELLNTSRRFIYREQINFTSLQRIFELVGTSDWKYDMYIASIETLDNLPIEYPELFI